MTVQEQVFQKISETLGVDASTLTPETTFSQIGADSLDMVEFSMDLEDMFKITLAQEDIAAIKNIGQAVEFIEKNKKDS
jgi:acyl carrier protein